MKRVYLFLLLIFTLGKTYGQNRFFENVLYKVSEKGDSLLLDIYLPQQKTENERFPVLMIIHGGAWVEGDKTLESLYYMRKLRDEAIKNNFAVVSINYRLLGKEIHFPAPVLDCKDAVRWIRANASGYGFDTENIGLWGGSAGGHLALLVGYREDSLWKDDIQLAEYPSHVNYIIDNFGPTDLNKLLKTNAGFLTIFFFKTFLPGLYDIRNKLILAMTNTTLKADEEKVIEILKTYSPVTYLEEETVPTLILHGTKDKVVPFKESKKLNKLLNGLNSENELIKVRKGDHGFNNINHERIDELVSETIDFMKKHTYVQTGKLSINH